MFTQSSKHSRLNRGQTTIPLQLGSLLRPKCWTAIVDEQGRGSQLPKDVRPFVRLPPLPDHQICRSGATSVSGFAKSMGVIASADSFESRTLARELLATLIGSDGRVRFKSIGGFHCHVTNRYHFQLCTGKYSMMVATSFT